MKPKKKAFITSYLQNILTDYEGKNKDIHTACANLMEEHILG